MYQSTRRLQLLVALSSSFHICVTLSHFSPVPLDTQAASTSTSSSSSDENIHLTQGIPFSSEFTEDSEREFVYSNTLDVFIMTVKNLNGSSQRNDSTPELKLNNFEGNCLESISEMSWMCYNLPKKNIPQKFSLYNPGSNFSFEIMISEATVQQIIPPTEIQLNPSISGFGTLFKVHLPETGVLRVRVDQTTKGQPLPIIGASSLGDLFCILSGNTLNSSSSEPEPNSSLDQELIIQNKQLSSSWYYFYLNPRSYARQSFLTIQVGNETAISPNDHANYTRIFDIEVGKLDEISLALIIFLSGYLIKKCSEDKTTNNDSEESDVQQAQILKKLEEQEKKENVVDTFIAIMEESEVAENNTHLAIEISDEESCDICYGITKSVTFEPCGHKCTCASCARAIVLRSMKCPLCRTNIKQVQIGQNIENNEALSIF